MQKIKTAAMVALGFGASSLGLFTDLSWLRLRPFANVTITDGAGSFFLALPVRLQRPEKRSSDRALSCRHKINCDYWVE